MIVYLASYPRSGNSWIRRLLRNQFRYIDSPVHGDPDTQREKFLQEEWTLEGHFEFSYFPAAGSGQLFARYVSLDPPSAERLLLMPGNWKVLENEAVRRELAGSEHVIFVKTHLHPYARYFPGERVVQPVRHPGAAIWSYFNFFRDVRKRDVTLEAVIEGHEGFGCWTRYHEAWDRAASDLDQKILRVHYEDLFDKELGFCERLLEFIEQPIVSCELKPFSYYQGRIPGYARSGYIDEWKFHYSPRQLDLLTERHGPQMQRLGYSVSELGLSGLVSEVRHQGNSPDS